MPEEPSKLSVAYDLIKSHLQSIENPIVVELGMCDGCHTHMLLSWCSHRAYYFGFEPDPRNVLNIVNRGIHRCIEFYSEAIGNVTEIVPFWMATPDQHGVAGSSSLSEFQPALTENWPWLKCLGHTMVQCWKLDDFCAKRGLDHIDFLWMDVQGAERLVFDGAPEILKKTKMVWTEFDGGTLYKHSSTFQDIINRFPGWEVVCRCDGDVLLKNPSM